MSATLSVLSAIARPYAAALFDLANEAGKVQETEADLDAVASLIETSEDFKRFLTSPAIPADTKREALDAILAKTTISELAGNTLRLVAKNGRLFALPALIAAFKDMAAAARGEMRADVTSAAPLSTAQKEQLEKVLAEKAGKTISLNTRVDESLIGGLVVKIGSQMIDTSLKTKLSAMKIAMKGVS